MQDSKCKDCGHLFKMSLNVNVSSLACDQTYLDDFQKLVALMFGQDQDNLDSIQVEMIKIPDIYTQDKKICEWKCSEDGSETWQLTPKPVRAKAGGEEVTVSVSITDPVKFFGQVAKCTSGMYTFFVGVSACASLLNAHILIKNCVVQGARIYSRRMHKRLCSSTQSLYL